MRRWFARVLFVTTLAVLLWSALGTGTLGLVALGLCGVWFLVYALTDEFTKGLGD